MAYQYIEITRKPLLLTQVLDAETEQRIQKEIDLARSAPELHRTATALLAHIEKYFPEVGSIGGKESIIMDELRAAIR